MSVLSCNIGKSFLGGKLTFLTFDILANYLIKAGRINNKEEVLHIPPYELNNFLDGFFSYMIQSLQIKN
ncbi:hypothetical protein [Bacillus pseudomycoides]|uniref:Uncharacterized protein n=1 Tax=Bacillus pseudomycoides TaxID=64104 RepID=A0ABD6TCJ6_9BACI|nr:hypothetical protein [Bacillus pseudomycoides]KFN10989.1 hypothetical protein DJ94_5440 [Bacillus pseudomycoides]MCR8860386.1 hypothetical protein [Bacillus pseudomycoides]MDR4188058.1 hypothetical protein [Bacillus pseudomycoides]MED0855675.1 hypothetical protein [Bacillus pseudomycoides]PEN08561.1 hypothetical protein CN640_13030 [Bacillus pseudomycoides]